MGVWGECECSIRARRQRIEELLAVNVETRMEAIRRNDEAVFAAAHNARRILTAELESLSVA